MTGLMESSPPCGEGPTKLRRSESKGLHGCGWFEIQTDVKIFM